MYKVHYGGRLIREAGPVFCEEAISKCKGHNNDPNYHPNRPSFV